MVHQMTKVSKQFIMLVNSNESRKSTSQINHSSTLRLRLSCLLGEMSQSPVT